MKKYLNKTELKRLGLTLKHARLKAGLSQLDLAKILGYEGAQFVSNCERGLCLLPLTKVAKVKRALDIEDTDFALLMLMAVGKHLERQGLLKDWEIYVKGRRRPKKP